MRLWWHESEPGTGSESLEVQVRGERATGTTAEGETGEHDQQQRGRAFEPGGEELEGSAQNSASNVTLYGARHGGKRKEKKR